MKDSLQVYADKVTHPDFKQPLKTIEEALETMGWENVECPDCCGNPVEIRSMIGSAYYVECPI